MKKLLFCLLFFLAMGLAVQAQPNYVGVMFSAEPSDGKDGNGTGIGVTGSATWAVPDYEWLRVKSEVKYSRDPKGYRDQSGNAWRNRNLVRAYLPGGQGIFLQGGFYYSHISFKDTPGTTDGYSKWIFQPIFGAGVELSPYKDKLSIVVDYRYFVKGNLKAKPYDGGATVVDGTSQTHEVEAAMLWSVNPKWAVLVSAKANRSTYVRDPVLYGPALGGIKHQSNAFEIGLGIARRFKTR